jgi:hypothetical protein
LRRSPLRVETCWQTGTYLLSAAPYVPYQAYRSSDVSRPSCTPYSLISSRPN